MAQSVVKRGSVVLIRYPFADLTGAKVHPALVLTPDHLLPRLDDVLCLFISSAMPDDRLRRQLGSVEFVGGQDATTVLVDEGLSGSERDGQGRGGPRLGYGKGLGTRHRVNVSTLLLLNGCGPDQCQNLNVILWRHIPE